jgi:hypothetical protein
MLLNVKHEENMKTMIVAAEELMYDATGQEIKT